jgi:vacuolar-type H+-ATPase subunit I/STV1
LEGGTMTKEEKIELIKENLKKFKSEALKQIVTRKKEENTIFFRKSALDKFLDSCYTYFTDEELELLEYNKNSNEIIEYIDILDEEKKEVKEKTTPKLQETTKNFDIQKNTFVVIKEKLENEDIANKFIYLLDNIDTILAGKKMVEKTIFIPNEVLELESFPTSVRISKELLERFNKLCLNYKNYSKIQLLNYVLYEFLEKYEDK